MRKFVTLASIVVLAASAVACGQSSNSATDILSLGSPVSPSALEARTGGTTGGKGGGKGSGGTTTGGGGGSLSWKMVVDTNGNGSPNWNDTITFNVSTSATTEPHVSLSCSQNGNVVFGGTTGFYASYPWPWTNYMTLNTQSWTSGAADCTARLYYINGTSTVTLTSISFHVDA